MGLGATGFLVGVGCEGLGLEGWLGSYVWVFRLCVHSHFCCF